MDILHTLTMFYIQLNLYNRTTTESEEFLHLGSIIIAQKYIKTSL